MKGLSGDQNGLFFDTDRFFPLPSASLSLFSFLEVKKVSVLSETGGVKEIGS